MTDETAADTPAADAKTPAAGRAVADTPAADAKTPAAGRAVADAETPAVAETPAGDEIGYTEALAELSEILHELDGDEVDVDVLGGRVRRAAELLRICRGRIASARFEVEQVVAELDSTALPPDPDPDADDPEGGADI